MKIRRLNTALTALFKGVGMNEQNIKEKLQQEIDELRKMIETGKEKGEKELENESKDKAKDKATKKEDTKPEPKKDKAQPPKAKTDKRPKKVYQPTPKPFDISKLDDKGRKELDDMAEEFIEARGDKDVTTMIQIQSDVHKIGLDDKAFEEIINEVEINLSKKQKVEPEPILLTDPKKSDDKSDLESLLGSDDTPNDSSKEPILLTDPKKPTIKPDKSEKKVEKANNLDEIPDVFFEKMENCEHPSAKRIMRLTYDTIDPSLTEAYLPGVEKIRTNLNEFFVKTYNSLPSNYQSIDLVKHIDDLKKILKL